ncbi:MAG: lipid-A-disaccharide synthase [Lutibacter sp.]|jgi:lipid-A-disaccharide synthase|nr:lipid-A-disaccharide synthase [Lutibacter sp.]
MKYYIISGEASGDLHGANLMKSLFLQDPAAEVRFFGGDLMQQVGGTLVKHYRDLAFMGFAEVLMNLRTILKNIRFCKKDLMAFAPDALVLIDYPGFNMRIAAFAKKQGIPVHYYISPQIWAWKEGRIDKIKRDVDALYVILPFEKDFYEQKHQFPVHFVGHPLIDAIADRPSRDPRDFRSTHGLSNKPIIALLPGSRKQEIRKMLSIMLRMPKQFPDFQFVIAGAPSQEEAFYKQFINGENVHFISNKTYDLLSVSFAAVVTSGTATLETALFKVPQIVVYKTSWLSYQIGKRLINLRFISLVNLIMDRKVVEELIQDRFNAQILETSLEELLGNDTRSRILSDYEQLEQQLGGQGASQKVATLVHQKISGAC